LSSTSPFPVLVVIFPILVLFILLQSPLVFAKSLPIFYAYSLLALPLMVFPHKLEKNNKNLECKDKHKKLARKKKSGMVPFLEELVRVEITIQKWPNVGRFTLGYQTITPR